MAHTGAAWAMERRRRRHERKKTSCRAMNCIDAMCVPIPLKVYVLVECMFLAME